MILRIPPSGRSSVAITSPGLVVPPHSRESVTLDEELTFPAKMTSPVDFTQNDFYECGPSAGAGWGDPIVREAERVAAESRGKLEEFVARRTKQAEAKIGQAEVQALADVRAAASELMSR